MSKRTARGQVIELGGEPRINFLPGEIQQRKDARRRRRSLFMLVILIGVLCTIGYVYSAQYATDRQAALEAEQQTTLDLLVQQGQFGEARTMANEVVIIGKAISHASAHEVAWRELVRDMRQTLPSGAVLNIWTVKGLTLSDAPVPSNALFPVTQVAQIDLDVSATSLALLGATMDRLAEYPGVISVEMTAASLIEGETSYGSVITVRFNSEVLTGRFSDGWVPGMTPIEPTTPPVPTEEPIDESSEEQTDTSEEGE